MFKIFKKIFPNTEGIGEGIANIVDRFVRTKEEKAEFEKEMTELLHRADENEQKHTTERWKFDMTSDSWLSKNVRPLILIKLFYMILILAILDSSIVDFVVDEGWVTLIKTLALTVFGAYFGDRAIRGYQTIKNKSETKK